MELAYTQRQIDILSANSGDKIQKKETIGFVITDCDIVKNVMLGIMRHTIKENNIFNYDRIVDLNSIYTKLSYDY